MFQELGVPGSPDWEYHGTDSLPLREWIMMLATQMKKIWRAAPRTRGGGIARTRHEARLHLAALRSAAVIRRELDREILLLVAQAEEAGYTWSAIAEALMTTPQNANKVYGRRVKSVRQWVAQGIELDDALDELARRRT